jgi:hypothetical protein
MMGSELAVQETTASNSCSRLGSPTGASPAAEAGGQALAALQRAVGHRHRLGRTRREVRGHQFDHLAGADEEHLHLGQVLEQLRRQPHRGRGHADAVRADLGGRAHFLGHRKGALEQLVQRGAQRAGFVGHAHGLLHLAQDLRLAEHHRIEPGRHPEGVARRARSSAHSCGPATGCR